MNSMSESTSPSFNISKDTLYFKAYHLVTWLCMTNSKNFGATYSKNCCGFVSLQTRTTSFRSHAQISHIETFSKCFQAIKLSLAISTSQLQSGKIWKPHSTHLFFTQSRLNHFFCH